MSSVANRLISSAEEAGCLPKSKSRLARENMLHLWSPIDVDASGDLQECLKLSETLIFIFEEIRKTRICAWCPVLGKLKTEKSLPLRTIYGPKSKRLKGPDIDQFQFYVKLLNSCINFSKKPFPIFLGAAGYSEENVLLKKAKAKFLKPAFVVLRDDESKCFFILIRGTHSCKDWLTNATGAPVRFDLSSVKGHAHRGMVAAAEWIEKECTPTLMTAFEQNPGYGVKIFGHSLGGGTAALLTCRLREKEIFSAATCVAFGAPACMTWDLAESGRDFITTIINGADIVPTLSQPAFRTFVGKVIASSSSTSPRDPGCSMLSIFDCADRLAQYEAKEVVKIDSSTLNSQTDAFKLRDEVAKLREEVAVESHAHISSPDISNNGRLYPPGRILHMISSASPLKPAGEAGKPRVEIYETVRAAYGLLRFSRDKIIHHHMPKYVEMMELLIEQEKESKNFS